MHAERDYLVKSVFPELSEWCDVRKLRLIDIDLRWGVTAADSEAKNTVRACLRNIDECRPFFLCFMGQRRGWIPTPGDIGEETYNLFPSLRKKRYAGEASVTEMEILHALIDPLHNGVLRGTKDDSRSGQAVEHAFFYLREPSYLDKLPHSDLRFVYTNEAEKDKVTADKELARWRDEEIPHTGRPIHTYSADWQMNESTPEIALPLCVPTTSPKDSDSWRQAFIGWKKRWEAVGVKVDESGEIKGTELVKANEYNKVFTHGRLGGFETDNSPLSELIIAELKEAIAKRFLGHMTIDELTPLQKELDQQAQFLRIAGDGFIEREGDFDALNEYIKGNETRPFALTAFAGMGKTSLLAHFIDTYSAKSGETLHYRFIGGSDGSVSTERLIRSLLDELKEAGKIKSDIPTNSIDMMNKLSDFLEEAGKTGKTVIVIDALNQLEFGMDDLYWIPTALPKNVKLIISFKRSNRKLHTFYRTNGDEKSADEYYWNLEQHGTMVLQTVKPFDSAEDRKALVSAYLETYFKELDEPRIESLVNSEGADNPLFLKAALSELRVFGVHNDLTEVIKNRFGNTPVTAFNAILSRMENDAAYTKLTPAVMLPNLFGWITHSRYGMSIDELAEISVRERLTENKADALDAIYLIFRQLRPFLAKRDGRADFFYESFKIAAKERYTGNHKYARESKDWHKSLAEYFETLPLTNRHKLMEQARQYNEASMEDEYKNLIFDYYYIEARLREFGVMGLISDFAYSSYVQSRDRSIKLLSKFHTLSEHILAFDPSQLASQLWGRMADFEEDEIKRLLKQAVDVKKERGEIWVRPQKACMPKPDSGIVRILHSSSPEYAVSPNEELIIYNDKVTDKLTIKELKTGRTLREFEIHTMHILALTDGIHALIIDYDHRMGLLNLTTGDIKYFEEKVLPYVNVFISSGKIAVTRTIAGGIQIWDIEKIKFIANIRGSWNKNFPKLMLSIKHSAALTEDGTKLITGCNDDNSVRVYDTATGECLKILAGHDFEPVDFFIDDRADNIYSFSHGQLVAFRLSTGEKLYSHYIEQSNDFVLSPYGRYLVFGTININIYEARTGKGLFSISAERYHIKDYLFAKDEQTIIAIGYNQNIRFWDIDRFYWLSNFIGHFEKIVQTHCTYEGHYFITSSLDNTIKIWNLWDCPRYKELPKTTFRSLAMFGDKQFIAGSDLSRDIITSGVYILAPRIFTTLRDMDGNLIDFATVYDPVTLQRKSGYPLELKSVNQGTEGLNNDTDRENDRIIISSRNWAEIRSLSKGYIVSEIRVLTDDGKKKEPFDDLRNAKLIDSGKKVIAICKKKAFIIDVKTEKLVYSFTVGETHNAEIMGWKLLADRKRILTYSKVGNETKLWDIENQKELMVFDKIGGDIQTLDLMPDESAFIICSDGKLSKWDMITGLESDKPIIEDNSTIADELRSLHGLLFLGHEDYVWISTVGKMPVLALVNCKTGHIVTYFRNDMMFEWAVSKPSGEHIACINKGELSFLQLENMDWNDTYEEPPDLPIEKPKGFFARLFGKK
jgi:WD40 repeat protein